MEYLEGGRFGRITKNLRKQGYEKEMEDILHDSTGFPKLKKPEQTKYVETVIGRLKESIGEDKTNKILFDCGAKCCSKLWTSFVKNIWSQSESLQDFFKLLNEEEEKYNTTLEYNSTDNTITVQRSKCICGMINKGKPFTTHKEYCMCSIGHMSVFFNTVFDVKEINILGSIYSGSEKCTWLVELGDIDKPAI
ncbi:MAG: DUF6144 family protein [Desulfotalea sp.]